MFLKLNLESQKKNVFIAKKIIQIKTQAENNMLMCEYNTTQVCVCVCQVLKVSFLTVKIFQQWLEEFFKDDSRRSLIFVSQSNVSNIFVFVSRVESE